jgi:hypothetical protein
MQHATKYISPQQPVIDKKFWAMVKETEKQFVPSLRRFDVDLTVPPDAQRRRLVVVEALQEEEDKKVVVVEEKTTTIKMKRMRIAAACVATRFFVRRWVLSSVVSPSLFVHSIPSDQFHNLSDTSINQGLDGDYMDAIGLAYSMWRLASQSDFL